MEKKIKKSTGVAVPLGALRTENSPFIGEYTSLKRFALFCKNSGLSVIQLLPVLDTGTQSSPYSSLSAFALHPIYINLPMIPMFDKCYSSDAEFKKMYDELLSLSDDTRFDYRRILDLKEALLRKLFRTMRNVENETVSKCRDDFFDFIERNGKWMKPYCVFKHLKYKYMQAGWKNWAEEDKNLTEEEILRRWNDESLVHKHRYYAWQQFVARKELLDSAEYVRSLGLTLKGDIPILLNEDSCDVWGNPGLFNMKMRAGSPPDGDNPTGQNWGFPVYDWESQEENGFSWWRDRLKSAGEYFGAYRLDHIPGFFRFWAVNEGEETAELGWQVPCSPISEKSLETLGFSKERIRWLKEPHIATELIFKKTGDLDKAYAILSLFCERIGREELWLFKRSFKSTSDLRKVSLEGFELDEALQDDIRCLFCRWWKNRTLIEVKKGQLVPNFKFGETRAWGTLSQAERDALLSAFDKSGKKQELKWKRQAERIFSSIIPATGMVPCGEDLGVSIGCMQSVLDEFGILGLKVVRWCRDWASDGQPFFDFGSYRDLSLVTTSVHDSSTIREWWNSEKDSTKAFCQSIIERRKAKRSGGSACAVEEQDAAIWGRRFDPAVADFVLSNCALTSGVWFVNPLQDWLYLDGSLYLERAEDERINIPGTVSEFNWTWRMPTTVENLSGNGELLEKINRIARIHDEQ